MANRYISNYTGEEVDASVRKTKKIPNITNIDNGKILQVNNEGNLILSNLKTINNTSLFGDENFSFYSKEEINENFIKKYEEIPEASQNYLGEIIQYTGSSTPYINGYFYQCVEGETAGTYVWNQIDVQPASNVSVSETPPSGTTPPIPVVQYITIDGETSKLAGGIANGIAYEQIEEVIS